MLADPVPSFLRLYDPRECDERGVPRGWLQCVTCHGTGLHSYARPGGVPSAAQSCATCWGFGALRESAIAWLVEHRRAGTPLDAEAYARRAHEHGIRCEGCAHPMSTADLADDGGGPRWSQAVEARRWAFSHLSMGTEPPLENGAFPINTQWSVCDRDCAHHGVSRQRIIATGEIIALRHERGFEATRPLASAEGPTVVESAWRSVDIRALGWPADLSPEALALLCLHCYAERWRGAPNTSVEMAFALERPPAIAEAA